MSVASEASKYREGCVQADSMPMALGVSTSAICWATHLAVLGVHLFP